LAEDEIAEGNHLEYGNPLYKKKYNNQSKDKYGNKGQQEKNVFNDCFFKLSGHNETFEKLCFRSLLGA